MRKLGFRASGSRFMGFCQGYIGICKDAYGLGFPRSRGPLLEVPILRILLRG